MRTMDEETDGQVDQDDRYGHTVSPHRSPACSYYYAHDSAILSLCWLGVKLRMKPIASEDREIWLSVWRPSIPGGMKKPLELA